MPIVAIVLATLSAGRLAAQEDRLGGRAFEFGVVAGYATFQKDAGLDDCLWLGARFGHRFNPLRGIERVQFGFRAGWEGCFTDHREVGRVDVIHLSLAWLTGIRTGESLMWYWETGLGEVIGDSTPGRDNQVLPRFSIHVGPGLKWAVGKNLLLDLSVKGLIFESFEFGSSPPGGTLGVVPSISFSLQI